MEYMDWYFRRQSENLTDPSDHEAPQISFLSPINEWDQWGSLDPQNFEYVNAYCSTSTKTECEDLSMGSRSFYAQGDSRPSHEEEGSTSSSACGPLLISSTGRMPQSSSQNQQHFSTHNNMEQLDDIFLSSLLEDDLKSRENTLGQIPILSGEFKSSPDNHWADPLHVDILEGEPCSLSLSDNAVSGDQRKVEGSSFWCLLPEDYSKPKDLPTVPTVSTFTSARSSVLNEGGDGVMENELKSMEVTVLHELEDVMIQLNKGMRICFRDALYRLAKSSRHQHKRSANSTEGFRNHASVPDINSEKSRLKQPNNAEPGINAIDRTVANLMFTKSCIAPQDILCPAPTARVYEGNPLAFGSDQACDLSSLFPVSQNTRRSQAKVSKNEPETAIGYTLQRSSYMDMIS